ncbi:MAG: hypothetical protein IPK80_03825 [Nannocystis sp.]|jgi:hypothetical protein|nr:hypothetical protein [Nannocystis sp.]
MNKIDLQLSIDDTNLILEALGQLPFARVFQLIARIQEQARAQLSAAERAQAGGPERGE